MKKVLLIYAVLIAGILIWYYGVGKERRIFENAKEAALKVSQHSAQFNRSIEEIMKTYYQMTGDFANEDTLGIDRNASKLKGDLDSLKIDELKADSSIYETARTIWDDARVEISGMKSDPSLQAKRESLNLFSNELFTFLLSIRYDLGRLYWQECSFAFGDDTAGNWISDSEISRNPYGKKDCATVKKVIDFTKAASPAR